MAPNPLRIGACLAVAGICIAGAGTSIHGGSDPADFQRVLPEYAANTHWKTAHLAEFIGFLLIAGSLVVLLNHLKEKTGSVFSRLGLFTLVIATGTYAANHAVDGIAIKYVADSWAGAPAADQALLFRLAETVRHIEQGLTSFVTLTLGLTLLLTGLAALQSRLPRWFGMAALLVGAAYLTCGIRLYYFGFAEHALAFWVGTSLTVWLLAAAFLMWREGRGNRTCQPLAPHHPQEIQ